jgi:TRAP-type mannitol/chloroaromatic compound transport system permease large subunit
LLIFLRGGFPRVFGNLFFCFIVVPILTPIAEHFQIDLLWFAILIAVNLQTSFLTPPFGFSLFYLKAVAPNTLRIGTIYQGIIPFVILQVFGLILLTIFPQITLWLPERVDKWFNYQ